MKNAMTVESNDKNKGRYDFMSPIFSYVFSGIAVLAVVYLIFFMFRLINASAEKERRTREEMMNGSFQNMIPGNGDVPFGADRNIFEQQADWTVQSTNLPVFRNAESADSNNAVPQNDKAEHILFGTSSVIGTRKTQQDAVVVSDTEFLQSNDFNRGIAVLCDGMGGLSGGELASFVTTKTIHDDFVFMNPENIPEFFKAEVIKTDEIVYGLQDETGKLLGAGSTLASVVIDGDKLYWVSVGDSRIYIIRNSEMVQVTNDHNYYTLLKQKADSGQITQEEARNDPRADALISFIGIGKGSLTDLNEQPFVLQNGDTILLCSDGLYKTLSDQTIAQILLANGQNPSSAATALTQAVMAENKRGQDNATVAVVKYYK